MTNSELISWARGRAAAFHLGPIAVGLRHIADALEVAEAVTLAQAKELALVRAQRDNALLMLQRFGVCVSCWYGTPEPHGCTDCLNTGFIEGRSPEETERAAILADLEAAAFGPTILTQMIPIADVRAVIAARYRAGTIPAKTAAPPAPASNGPVQQAPRTRVRGYEWATPQECEDLPCKH